jgi:hypothetical protein
MSQPELPNKITRDVIEQRTKECGVDAGKGGDSQIKYHLTLLEGAYHGVLDPVKHKDPQDPTKVLRDDASDLSEIYYKAQSGANTFNAKAGNQRKLISTSRLSLRGGQCTKGDILATVNDLMNIRNKLKKDPKNAPRLDDAVNVLHRALRVQLKPDRAGPLEKEELESLCFKKVKDPRSLEKFWEDTDKTFRKLALGTLQSSQLEDTAAEVAAVRDLCKQRLRTLRGQIDEDAEAEAAEAAEVPEA